MKKINKIFAIIFCCVFFIASCGKTAEENQKDDLGSFADQNMITEDTEDFIIKDSPGILDIPGQTLNITYHTGYIPDRIGEMIEIFRRMYPNITVNTTIIRGGYSYAAQMQGLERQNYPTIFYDILTSENVPDLIMAPFQYDRLALYDEQLHGKLADLSELMANDLLFVESDYYMSAINVFEYDDKLYEFPILFQNIFVAVNNKISDEFTDLFKTHKTVNIKNLLDIQNNLNTGGRSLYDSFDTFHAARNMLGGYLSLADRKADFLNPSFIDLLDNAKRWSDPEKPEDSFFFPYNVHTGVVLELDERKLIQNYSFINHFHDTFQYFLSAEPGSSPGFSYGKPLADAEGNILMNDSIRFCISEESQSKDLAWELIKFLASPEAFGYGNIRVGATQLALNSYISVNRHVIPFYFDFLVYSDGISQKMRFDSFKWKFDGTREEQATFIDDYFYEMLSSPMSIIEFEPWFAYQPLVVFHLGQSDAYEAAELLQSMLTEYFNYLASEGQ
ncbi:MAG: extracellular solute-binding protein [Defluviitaleaceae bacterium]|nr:extracellular solute-binding protein [Defluviitaleaceae bacterium]